MNEETKKIILKERETREKITDIINNSQLPAFVLKGMIKDFFEQLVSLEKQQYNVVKNTEKEKQTKKVEE